MENIRTTGLLQVEGGSEIGFYVMNEGIFSTWSHRYPSVTSLAKPDAINYNFAFAPDVSGWFSLPDRLAGTTLTRNILHIQARYSVSWT